MHHLEAFRVHLERLADCRANTPIWTQSATTMTIFNTKIIILRSKPRPTPVKQTFMNVSRNFAASYVPNFESGLAALMESRLALQKNMYADKGFLGALGSLAGFSFFGLGEETFFSALGMVKFSRLGCWPGRAPARPNFSCDRDTNRGFSATFILTI